MTDHLIHYRHLFIFEGRSKSDTCPDVLDFCNEVMVSPGNRFDIPQEFLMFFRAL